MDDKKYILKSKCCNYDMQWTCFEFNDDNILVRSPTCVSFLNSSIITSIFLLKTLIATFLLNLIFACCVYVIEEFSNITDGICYKHLFFSSCVLSTFVITSLCFFIGALSYLIFVHGKKLYVKIQDELNKSDKSDKFDKSDTSNRSDESDNTQTYTKVLNDGDLDNSDNSCAIPKNNTKDNIKDKISNTEQLIEDHANINKDDAIIELI